MIRLFALILMLLALPAQAHFTDSGRPRIIMISPETDGLMVYLRVPMPIVFSDVINSAQRSGTPLKSPLLAFETQGAIGQYRLSVRALGLTLDDFETRITQMLAWTADGDAIRPVLLNWTIHPALPEDPFDTVEEAEAALSIPLPVVDPVFGSSFVDLKYRLPRVTAEMALTLQSSLPSFVLGSGITVDNHMVDLRQSPVATWFIDGQLRQPIAFVAE